MSRNQGVRYFTEEQVRNGLPMKEAISLLKRAFTDYAHGRAQNQPRRRLTLDTGSVLHSLAGAWGGYFGTKVYSTNPRHGAHFTVLLYDAETARPLAQFEANWLGQIRTGAVSGVAADLLAPSRPLRVGCIGTGFQAQSQLQAITAVRPLDSVRVWSRQAEKRELFAREMTRLLGTQVSAAVSAEAASEGSDVLVTATWSKEPVIQASAIPAGCLVLAVGSNNPKHRELPTETVTSSFVVVDDREACRIEAGDLLLAFDEEHWISAVELKDLVADPSRGSERGERTVVFKSVGLGLEDVAVAAYLYERA
jgi:ornithine cyclodeaminase/alanine dehydrogenase-like protein (mu-crystallin family)